MFVMSWMFVCLGQVRATEYVSMELSSLAVDVDLKTSLHWSNRRTKRT